MRETWVFEGFVVSDTNAARNLMTHGFAADLTDAGVRAVNVGIDVEMAMSDAAYSYLPAAVEAGQVSEEAIDACVRRVLRAKLQVGLFDDPVRRRGQGGPGAVRSGAPRRRPDHGGALGGAAAKGGVCCRCRRIHWARSL